MWWSRNKGLLFLIFSGAFILPAHGQIVNIERQRLNADTNGWFGDADLSFRVFKNTVPLYTFAEGVNLVYRKDKHQVFVVQNFMLVKSSGQSFANSGFLHGRYQFPANRRLMGEGFYQVQYNKLLLVAFRQLVGGGVRLELFDPKKNNRAFIGATLMNEYEIIQNRQEVNFDMRWSYYLALRLLLFNKLEWNSTTYYQPILAQSADYRLNTENSLLYSINRKIQLKFEVTYNFDSTPPLGVPKDTYFILNGLRYKFNS